ncbi:calcium-translocating P-type ATPase, PMCA-type [Candidatus Pacearchaeota archaeon]|nr:calcium-translocating P-type ATPase, PMCA-type [Candidatus Pacearchaeota archaeon]
MSFHSQTVEEVLNFFHVNSNGLNEIQVQERKNAYGLNELEKQKKTNPILLFLSQFKSFIIYILLFAVAISFLSGETTDTIVILAILLFNAVFGFAQEYKAEKSIEALKKLTALKSRVIRDNKITLVDAKELVPGDIILLEEGDKVPADSRLIETSNLESLESVLTGESSTVSKLPDVLNELTPLAERKNTVFSGTIITRGRGKAVITSIGMKTEIGKIAYMISQMKEEQTPLQKKLESTGRFIGLITILLCLIIFIIGIYKENLLPLLLSGDFLQFILSAKSWFLTAVSLAVAAVPEGLPAIVTIALAVGTIRMAKNNALIRKLPSVETLGETTVICSDKTGTLTKNEMTVKKAFINFQEISLSGEGYSTKGELKSQKRLSSKDLILFKIGALCNDASLDTEKSEITGDPTEAALLVSAEKSGINRKDLHQKYKRLNEDPFDSIRKMMSVVILAPEDKKNYVYTKGAPEKVLEKCNRFYQNGKIKKLDRKILSRIHEKNKEFASSALRVLAFAYKPYKKKEKLENNLIFVGLQAMIDPPREEVKEAIQLCKQAGVRVIMITGDNIYTAKAIAEDIEILGNAILGNEFVKLSEAEQQKILETTNIFARVEPIHKMQIVDILKKKGEIVAMTGDGVNDAPAIKKADIGIAMGIKGTDVTRESSDMVLADDNFASIVKAVKEGRGIHENISKFINYLLSCNIAEVLIILFAILLSWPLPLTAVMLLWINLLTDGLPALALSVDPYSQNIMARPPESAKNSIMGKKVTSQILTVSIIITTGILILFYFSMQKYSALAIQENQLYKMKIQTIAFTSIILTEMVRLHTVRSQYKLGIFSNKYLVFAVLLSVVLQISVIYTPLNKFFNTTPLSLSDWKLILIASLIVFLVSMIYNKLSNLFGK